MMIFIAFDNPEEDINKSKVSWFFLFLMAWYILLPVSFVIIKEMILYFSASEK